MDRKGVVYAATWWAIGRGGPSVFTFIWVFPTVTYLFYSLKGLSHEIFRPVFWPVWMHLAWMWTAYGFNIFLKLLRFLATILSFGALHTKPSRRFYESPRRIDNCLIETLMLMKNNLGEPLNWLSIILGDSMNFREVLIPFAAFLGEPLTQNKEKLEYRGLSCQLRISEKVWYECINT
jgi:hypothetical protein